MNFYSNKSINILSIFISIIIYILLTMYIPRLFISIKNYVYYRIQPSNMQDY